MVGRQAGRQAGRERREGMLSRDAHRFHPGVRGKGQREGSRARLSFPTDDDSHDVWMQSMRTES